MTKLEDSLGETLGLPDVIDVEATEVVEVQPVPQVPAVISDRIVDEDAALARENIRDAVTQGTLVLDQAVDVATASEHPRAFEVVGGLIKVIVDSNLALMDLQEKKKALKTRDGPVQQGVGPTNNLILTTEALQEMLAKGNET
jgi:hypothetical protein